MANLKTKDDIKDPHNPNIRVAPLKLRFTAMIKNAS